MATRWRTTCSMMNIVLEEPIRTKLVDHIFVSFSVAARLARVFQHGSWETYFCGRTKFVLDARDSSIALRNTRTTHHGVVLLEHGQVITETH